MRRRFYQSIIHLFIFLLAFVSFSKGQSYYSLDFVENKGQWDGNFKFRAEAGNGAFFIDPKGYTILQHHLEDFKKLSEKLHGHGARKPTQMILNIRILIVNSRNWLFRSHALKVMFLGSASDAQGYS